MNIKGIQPVVAVVIALIVVAIIGGYFIMQKDRVSSTDDQNLDVMDKKDSDSTDIVDPTPTPDSDIKTFEITAKNWEFSPNVIKVRLGDKVHLKLTSIEGKHGFSLSAFGIHEKINPGEPVEVDFVADEKGSFVWSCNVPCGPGHPGMKGTLIVE